jgi:hypothetical protein
MGMSLSESESFAFSRILNGTPTNLSCASSGPSSHLPCALGLHSFYFLFCFFVFFRWTFVKRQHGSVKRGHREMSPLNYPRPRSVGSIGNVSRTLGNMSPYNTDLNHKPQIKQVSKLINSSCSTFPHKKKDKKDFHIKKTSIEVVMIIHNICKTSSIALEYVACMAAKYEHILKIVCIFT